MFIKSYGCQMNVYDSERMADVLGKQGYAAAGALDDADLVILNTCHIREKATDKFYSELGRVNEVKARRAAQGKRTIVSVAGCVAQAEGDEIIRRAPDVDLVFGPQTYHELPQFLQLAATGRKVVATRLRAEGKFAGLPPRPVLRARPVSSFVSIQEGCDKFCGFCVVPYTRGAEFSRPAAQVLDEAEQLISAGTREIVLLGQNVNAYHGAGPDGGHWPLEKLIAKLAGLPGIARIRYMTSHPNDMSDGLIEAHRDIAKLMPYLHLPVQSGSDRVLSAMNRRHTRRDYFRIIEKLRKVRPDIAFSSDFIAGFPGETEQDFNETMSLAREIGFASAYSFKYSARPGTPAEAAAAQVDEAAKTRRLLALQALLLDQQRAFNQATVGRALDVLVEKTGRRAFQLGGKTPYHQAAHFDGGAELIGQVVRVEIIEMLANSLTARAIRQGRTIELEAGL